jgi:hypothetical protein
MVHIPTWLDMLMLFVAFVMSGVQHTMKVDESNSLLNVRFGLVVLCFILMVLTVFFNKGASWTSTGLFLAAAVCFGTAIRLQWLMPAKNK